MFLFMIIFLKVDSGNYKIAYEQQTDCFSHLTNYFGNPHIVA